MLSAPLQHFNGEVEGLLRPKNPAARSLLAFIRRSLWQCQLQGQLSEADVFLEAYLRGTAHCCQHQAPPIRNVQAWLRSTAFTIIRERYESTAARPSPPQADPPDILSPLRAASQALGIETMTTDMEAVIRAFSRLSAFEQQIMQMQILEGLSWRLIRQALINAGQAPLTEDALRQCGQQALENLRLEYHDLRPQS